MRNFVLEACIAMTEILWNVGGKYFVSFIIR